MRKHALVFFWAVCQALSAQLIINEHIVAYDGLTHTWLAVLPELKFGQDNCLSISLQGDWKQITINGETINDYYTFRKVTADSLYQTSIIDSQDRTITGNIQFTFLPIIHLHGNFGYDYQNGLVTIIDPDLIKDDILESKIKWRGGTTNAPNKHKRNYKLKFPQDVTFPGLRSDNDWILDAGQADVFRLRNRIAMDLWNEMAHKPYYIDQEMKARNGVRGMVVEVFLNEEYQGIYNLSENIDRKQLKLKKKDQETGDIHGCLYKGVEWDGTQMFDLLDYDNHSETLRGFEVKYPDFNDNDTTDWKPLVDAVNTIRNYNKKDFINHVNEWFDIPVLIDYSIFLAVVNALDNSGKNMYWAIYDKQHDKKLTPSPWDLDCTFGQRWGGTLIGKDVDMSSPEYLTDVDIYVFYMLYLTNAHQFNEKLNQRYLELRQTGNILSTESLINRVNQYYQKIKNCGASRRETDRWSGDSDLKGEIINFDNEYKYICNWIKKHLELIDFAMFPLYYEEDLSTFINQLQVNNKTHSSAQFLFNLKGQRINNTYRQKPDMYIKNGKKIIINK